VVKTKQTYVVAVLSATGRVESYWQLSCASLKEAEKYFFHQLEQNKTLARNHKHFGIVRVSDSKVVVRYETKLDN
jgi:hypothetical protein